MCDSFYLVFVCSFLFLSVGFFSCDGIARTALKGVATPSLDYTIIEFKIMC